MRIFKYWTEYTNDLFVDGEKQVSKIYGGSDISPETALADAKIRLSRIQKIIDGKLIDDTTYEADIKEEIIHKIDDKNIVTRNRYGALVLNSKDLMFIDVDDYRPSLYDLIFNRNISAKEQMLAQIEKTAGKKKYSGFGFRVYETFKGYRIIVTNKKIDARSKESSALMKDFNSDYLYRHLCLKQNCYRARLTPKPYRMRHKAIKVIFPNRNPAQEKELAD